MKKIEIIWHHLLWSALEKGELKHTQKSLAVNFNFSLSTVNLAVRKVSDVGAVKISGKYFIVSDPKKLLYFWATHRNLNKDIIYQTYSKDNILEIEGIAPAEVIFAGFAAATKILVEPPADYSKVYFYIDQKNLEVVKKRYPEKNSKNQANIFVLKSYPKQIKYGPTTTLPQTFVDLWGLSDWYAKDFIISLESRINELLGPLV